MASYQIELTEEAKGDLSSYNAYERKTIVVAIRDQLTHQPMDATRNRKQLRENPIARWELRFDKFRIFYEVLEDSQIVAVVAVGHKEHASLFIRGAKVKL
jgi:mRNA-degrading endonuclease RelE of RelBE toxin-antitoxin system